MEQIPAALKSFNRWDLALRLPKLLCTSLVEMNEKL